MNAVIFDMDGTLVDSDEFAAHAAEDALKIYFDQRGLPVVIPSRAHRRALVGLPSLEYFAGLLPDDRRHDSSNLRELVVRFEEERLARGEGRVFAGVVETLGGLRSSGWRVGLVSNCGRRYFEAARKHLRLGELVEQALCLDDHPTKTENVRRMMKHFGAARGVMVGDRDADIAAGKANGLRTVGCLYGYGKQGELDGADARINSIAELTDLVKRFA